MKKIILTTIVAVLCACSNQSGNIANSANWTAEYSSGVQVKQTPRGCWFMFPECPSHLNYLTKRYTGGVLTKIVAKIRVSGTSVKFKSLDSSKGLPPSIRLYLERDMGSEDGRWWSNPDSIVLNADGQTYTLEVPLDGNHWTNVNGKWAKDRWTQFQEFSKQIHKIGLTAGGGNSFGHGDCGQGEAKFEVVEYSVQ